jgi:hypothetical protein
MEQVHAHSARGIPTYDTFAALGTCVNRDDPGAIWGLSLGDGIRRERSTSLSAMQKPYRRENPERRS